MKDIEDVIKEKNLKKLTEFLKADNDEMGSRKFDCKFSDDLKVADENLVKLLDEITDMIEKKSATTNNKYGSELKVVNSKPITEFTSFKNIPPIDPLAKNKYNLKDCVDAFNIDDECRITDDIKISKEDREKLINRANDNVNHPSHYTYGTIEVIDYIEDCLSDDEFYGYCIGNVIKYISRAKHKHATPLEDLKKADWYLDRLIEHEKERKGGR